MVIDKLIKENNTFKDISKNYIPFFLDFSESTLSEIKYISSLEENTNKKFNKVTVDSRNINHQTILSTIYHSESLLQCNFGLYTLYKSMAARGYKVSIDVMDLMKC